MSGVASRPVETAIAGPVIKWAGGKTKLLPELLARMPERFGRYYEPFAGGAAMFFRLAPGRAVLADSNADLIGMYRALAERVETVIARLVEHSEAHGEARYLEVRDHWNRNAIDSIAERAAAFIYLNKTGFNGLWRVNRAGIYNVGYGKYASYTPDVAGIRAAAAVLQRATLRSGDYRSSLVDAAPGDFAYIDGPYDGTYGAYTRDKFDAAAQAELACDVRALARRGVYVMVSNADTPRIRALYAGLRVDVVQAARAINCDGEGRGKVDEVIVIAGYEPEEVRSR
jgi:DNA adenine methylase